MMDPVRQELIKFSFVGITESDATSIENNQRFVVNSFYELEITAMTLILHINIPLHKSLNCAEVNITSECDPTICFFVTHGWRVVISLKVMKQAFITLQSS